MNFLSKHPRKTLLAIAFSLFWLLPASHSFGEQQMREIVLNDGSIIHAKVLSLNDGVYELDSDTLGKIRMKEENITAIRKIQPATPAPDTTADQKNSKEEIKDVQSSLLSNPGIIGMIFELQNDPEVQKILQDKEIMALILSGDLETLQSNKKFVELMNNPKIRKILERTK